MAKQRFTITLKFGPTGATNWAKSFIEGHLTLNDRLDRLAELYPNANLTVELGWPDLTPTVSRNNRL